MDQKFRHHRLDSLYQNIDYNGQITIAVVFKNVFKTYFKSSSVYKFTLALATANLK